MQISDLPNQYTSTNTPAETVNATRGVERLVASVRNLTVGNIFEGTVNSIKGNQVLLGLSNGSELAARIEANMQMVQGQSMFFQVKSNDGATIAIRPYMVDGNGANLTLLNALKASNLPVTDKYLTMANTMMQEQMPIDKSSMGQMARILMNNPDMNVQTLVQMKKLNIPITTEMVSQFENYMNDKSAVHSALDTFINEFPAVLGSKNIPLEQMKAFDSELLLILAGDENNVQEMTEATHGTTQATQGTTEVTEATQSMTEATQGTTEATQGTTEAMQSTTEAAQTSAEGWHASEGPGGQIMDTTQNAPNAQASEAAQTMETAQTLDSPQLSGKVQLLLQNLFGDIGITPEDSQTAIIQKLAAHIATGENVTAEALEQLFSSKDMQDFLKETLEQQLLLKPKEVADAEKVKRLFERLDAKAQSIEALLQNAGLKDTPLAQTVHDIHANVEFMNQINEAYTFAQIPLKMANQNASGQLYVYTSKRNLEDPDRDLTAFLHLDLEHLGATDVSVRMHQKEVSTKFYMDSDASYDLVKAHMPQLEARIRAKGYSCKIEVANEGHHVDFVEGFLKKDAPSTGMVHRYSFDVRA